MTEVTPVLIPVLTENEILPSKSPFFFLKKITSVFIFIQNLKDFSSEKSNDIFILVGDLQRLAPSYFFSFGKRQFP